MGKSRRRRRTRDDQSPKNEPHLQQKTRVFPRHTISMTLKVVGTVVTLLATSLGFMTGYLSLVPRISVWQTQPLNPADPFSTPFIVSNDGPLGINLVKFSCLLLNVETANRNRFINVRLSSESLTVIGMEPGEKATVPCIFRQSIGLSDSDTIQTADVVIIVEFRPDFVLWRRTRRLRFVTLRSSDGNLYWYPQPYSRMATRE